MSSHREAPAISKDPVADNTDTYAFVSPDDPGTVTIISNYLPLEAPFGGPNFFEFGDDVLYEIHIDNDADGRPDITYQFEFTTQVRNPDTFLYNTGPITAIDSPNWNRRQFYSVTRVDRWRERVLATELACPPCNIGPSSTPNYDAAGAQAIHGIAGGHTVFAGQRLEGFYVDLGAIFDLGDLRPLQNLHLASMVPPAAGVNATHGFGVHAIALKIPISAADQGRLDADQPDVPEGGHRRVGGGQAAPGGGPRTRLRVRGRPVGPGVAPGQPAVQRGHRADGRQGPVERPTGVRGQAVPQVRPASGAGRVAARAVPGGLPQPRGAQGGAGGSGGHPADGASRRHRPGLPELHRDDVRRPVAPQRGHPADVERQGQRARGGRRRPRRVPERPPRVRRRRHGRAAGDRGADLPAGQPQLHPRRGGERDHRRPDLRQHQLPARSSRTWARRRAGLRRRRWRREGRDSR